MTDADGASRPPPARWHLMLHAPAGVALPEAMAPALRAAGIALTPAPSSWHADVRMLAARTPATDAHLLWLPGPPAAALPWLRAMRRQPLPVLLVSGTCPAEQLGRAVAAGAALHLVAPVSAGHLALALARICITAPDRGRGAPEATPAGWVLLLESGVLLHPNRTLVMLSAQEQALLQALAREDAPDAAPADVLRHAALYRLQRRIERESLGLRALHQPRPGCWALAVPLEIRTA